LTILITDDLRRELHAHLESVYPEEGAGFLLGVASAEPRQVLAVRPVVNAREDQARRRRYLIAPEDMLRADLEAEDQGLEIIGIFHSHPDCPNTPSEFDREWALPWYSYTITRVDRGQAVSLRAWRLSEDRERFEEEDVLP
jgi:proteasome lid subunit RPN8/RPN11